MYIDESHYLEQAKNINEQHKPVICNYWFDGTEDCWFWYQKPPVWSFLISIIFLIFGLNNHYALYFSSIMGSISIILIFLLAYLIFKKENTALWSAFLLVFTPIYILWSNSAENNSISVFFVLLTMIFFISYIERKEKSLLALVMVSLIFTSFVRFENIILILIFLVIYIISLKTHSNNYFLSLLKRFYPSIVVVILIIIVIIEPFFINLFRSSNISIIDRYYLNLFGFLKSVSFNFIYLFLAALSFVFTDKKTKNKVMYVFIVFIFYFILYLPLFSQSRMALTPGVFIIILSAYSLEKIANLSKKHTLAVKISIIFAFLFLFDLGIASTYKNIGNEFNDYPFELENAVLETESVMKIKNIIPESCYIIAEFPSVITSISDIKGITTDSAVENPKIIAELIKKGECIYYFYDGYCAEWTISPPKGSKERCRKMLQTFDYSKAMELRLDSAEYYLFKINGIFR